MGPEAIEDGVYTSSSDVWRYFMLTTAVVALMLVEKTNLLVACSFGIVLYELITFAKMPYAGLSNMVHTAFTVFHS
jgi:hypothetical protein